MILHRMGAAPYTYHSRTESPIVMATLTSSSSLLQMRQKVKRHLTINRLLT